MTTKKHTSVQGWSLRPPNSFLKRGSMSPTMIQTHEGLKILTKIRYLSKRKLTSLSTDGGVDPRLEMMAIMSIIPAIFPLRFIKILKLV
jgi:hypothetical protein